MAAGPTGPTAVSSNRTYSTTPRSVPRYVKSGVTLGGRKADCCERSFECFHLLNQAIALFERRNSTWRINSRLERPFSSRVFWARLLSSYESTYRSGLLAFFSSSVPASWDRKAASRRWETPRQWEVPNTQYGDQIRRDLRKHTPAEAHNAGLRWNQWGTSRSPPYCKPIPQNQ